MIKKGLFFSFISMFSILSFSRELPVEYHLQICHSNEQEIATRLNFKQKLIKYRNIVYLDTNDYYFHNHRKVIRLRWRDSGKGDITIKLRPVFNLSEVERWFGVKGFSCEYDLLGDRNRLSCKMGVKVSAQRILQFLNGDSSILELFSSKQLQFLMDGHLDSNALNYLLGYGVVQSTKYTGEFSNITKLEFESYYFKHLKVFELSFRDKAGSSKFIQLKAKLAQIGLKECEQQISKTRQILQQRVAN